MSSSDGRRRQRHGVHGRATESRAVDANEDRVARRCRLGGHAASVDSVSRSRTERLVNLVICLLSTRRFLTAAQIAATVPGYEHDPEDAREHEAFQRKFERDKAELRDLGVPLETGTASVFDTEPGYRIARREYALPDIHLEPDEAAAVGIAARLWRHAGLAAAASSGLAKLRAAGVEVDPHATLGVEPVVTVDPAFEPLTAAVRARRAGHLRLPAAGAATPPPPAGCSRGAWCAGGAGGTWWATTSTGTPPAASGCRRIVGAVRRAGRTGAYEPPPDLDLISYVAPVLRPGRAHRTAPRCWSGLAAPPGSGGGPRRRCRTPDGDRVVLRVRRRRLGRRRGWSATAPTSIVLDPPELRERGDRPAASRSRAGASGPAAGAPRPADRREVTA